MAGRPTKFKPEYVEQAHRLALLGLTNEQMAEFFEVDPATFYTWMDRHAELKRAVKAGKTEADAHVAEALYKRAIGYEVVESSERTEQVKVDGQPVEDAVQVSRTQTLRHIPASEKAATVWLRNRDPDRWKERLELTGKDGGPIAVEDQSVTEIARRMMYLLTAGAEESEE